AVEPQPVVVERVLGPVEQDVAVGVGGVLHGGLDQSAGGQLEHQLAAVGEVDASGELGDADGLGLSGGRARNGGVGCGGRWVAARGPRVERAVGVGPALPAGRQLGAEVVDVHLVRAAR